jgi:hypothetical protein
MRYGPSAHAPRPRSQAASDVVSKICRIGRQIVAPELHDRSAAVSDLDELRGNLHQLVAHTRLAILTVLVRRARAAQPPGR